MQFGLRQELRVETQKAYGNYCSYTRKMNKEPVPYYVFTDYYSKSSDITVKDVYALIHSAERGV